MPITKKRLRKILKGKKRQTFRKGRKRRRRRKGHAKKSRSFRRNRFTNIRRRSLKRRRRMKGGANKFKVGDDVTINYSSGSDRAERNGNHGTIKEVVAGGKYYMVLIAKPLTGTVTKLN